MGQSEETGTGCPSDELAPVAEIVDEFRTLVQRATPIRADSEWDASQDPSAAVAEGRRAYPCGPTKAAGFLFDSQSHLFRSPSNSKKACLVGKK